MVSVGVWQGASVGGIFEARSLESSLMFNTYFQKKFKGKSFMKKNKLGFRHISSWRTFTSTVRFLGSLQEVKGDARNI